MVIKKRSKVKQPVLKGNGNGKISYKARSSCQKLGSFFDCCSKEKEKDKKKK